MLKIELIYYLYTNFLQIEENILNWIVDNYKILPNFYIQEAMKV